MKFSLIIAFILSITFLALAQVPVAPVAPVVVPVVAPVVSLSFFGWLAANWAKLAPVLYVLIDLVIYFVPSLKANGLLNQIELWLKGQGQSPTS